MSAIERLRARGNGATPGEVREMLAEIDAEVERRVAAVAADRDRLAARVAELEGREASQREAAKQAWAASCVTADGRWAREPEAGDPCPVDEETIDRWAHGELDAVRVNGNGARGWALEHAEGQALAMQVARLTRQVEAMRGRG